MLRMIGDTVSHQAAATVKAQWPPPIVVRSTSHPRVADALDARTPLGAVCCAALAIISRCAAPCCAVFTVQAAGLDDVDADGPQQQQRRHRQQQAAVGEPVQLPWLGPILQTALVPPQVRWACACACQLFVCECRVNQDRADAIISRALECCCHKHWKHSMHVGRQSCQD